MKRLLFAIAFFCAAAQAQFLPITFNQGVVGFWVQGNSNSNNSSTSTAVAFSGNVTAGHVVCAQVGQGTFSAVAITVADTQGTGFVTLATNNTNYGSSMLCGIVPTTGADTVTVTFASAVQNIVTVNEYQAVTVEVDAVNTATAFGGGIPNPITTSITTTTAGDLLLTSLVMNGTPSGMGASPYTTRQALDQGTQGTASADNTQGAAGSQSSSWGWTSGGANAETAILAALRPATIGFSQVQTSGSCSSNTAANTQVYPARVLANDIGIIAYSSETTTGTPTIVDTLSTSWTLQVQNANGTSNKIWIWTGKFGSSGADTVTITFSGSFNCMQVNQWHGLAGVVTDTGTSSGSSGTMSWSQTVSAQPALIWGAVKSFHSSTTFTPGAGFLLASQQSGADSQGSQYQRVSSLSTVTFSMTVSTSDSNVGASITIH